MSDALSPQVDGRRGRRCIALLGRKDVPTDAVEEYCRYLSEALQAHNIQLEIRRVPWEIHGWRESLKALRLMAAQWKGNWVLIQYTALAWSSRGFPGRVLQVARLLRDAGVRLGIVYHDVEPYTGARWVDKGRRFLQVRTMRRLVALSDVAVFTVAIEKISWLPRNERRAVFVPVGANLPSPLEPSITDSRQGVPTVSVFSITGGEPGARETSDVVGAIRYAAKEIGQLRLLVFGRHAELRENALREGLRDLPVAVSVEGVIDENEIVNRLSASDVSLFIRGSISSRRGSAIAGIACGLPVIAFAGPETAAPITEAGVVLVPSDDPETLGRALVRVLSDTIYRSDLAERSRAAYREYFSWEAIARRFAAALSIIDSEK